VPYTARDTAGVNGALFWAASAMQAMCEIKIYGGSKDHLSKKLLDQYGKPRRGGRESGIQEIRDALGKLPGNN